MSVLERLHGLRAKRLQTVKKNRRDVYNEAKEANQQRSDGEYDQDREEDDGNDGDEEKADSAGKNANSQLDFLSYTAGEDAVWAKKQTEKTKGVQVDTINDFKKLAERTYKKQIGELTSTMAPEIQEDRKRKYTDLKDQGYNDVEIRTLLTDPESVKKESTRIKAFEARVYKKRASKQKSSMNDHGIAINERNRAFNEKLKRELKAYEEE